MHSWVEKEVADARALAGLANEPATEDHLLKLLEGLNIPLDHAPIPTPMCLWTATGPRIVIPAGWNGWSKDRRTVHELGHALLTFGVGPVLQHIADGNVRIERLARLWRDRDEAVAAEFVQLWCGDDASGDVCEGVDPRAE